MRALRWGLTATAFLAMTLALYDAGEYEGAIDQAMRREGAVQLAKKEYRTVTVTKNTRSARSKVLS